MEHESSGSCAIERIAHNGAIEPILVGCMDTQLMRAACNGFKAHDATHAAITLNSSNDPVTCHSRLAINKIDLLPRTVLVIGGERKFYDTITFFRHSPLLTPLAVYSDTP